MFSYLLLKNEAIPNFNMSTTYETRFTNRFRIFDKCYFLKKIDFENYTKIMNDSLEEGQEVKL